jgi:hypothetical protein
MNDYRLYENEIKFLFMKLSVAITSQLFCIFYYLKMAKPAETCCNKY